MESGVKEVKGTCISKEEGAGLLEYVQKMVKKLEDLYKHYLVGERNANLSNGKEEMPITGTEAETMGIITTTTKTKTITSKATI